MALKATIKHLLMLVLLNSPQVDARSFSFALAADMRGCAGSGNFDNSQYFRGVCEAIVKAGTGAFMIIPGDVDPQQGTVQWTIERYMGQSYPCYFVVGNHDAETPADMKWLCDYNKNGNSLPYIVNSGPQGCQETTYSFDYENTHFVMLNEYYNGQNDTGTDGDIVDALYEWLAADLVMTKKQHIFVIGHEPAFPQPDVDNRRERHVGDSLDEHPANRDRFWKLLRDRGVVAFICGHTHNHSVVNIDGVWQIDVGHARGIEDTGAPSTFLIVQIAGDSRKDIEITAYRDDHSGIYDYQDIVHHWDVCTAVRLASFTAHQDQGAIVLEWQTELEPLHLGFMLERQVLGMNDWVEIASYKSCNDLVGKSAGSYSTNYQYTDRTVQAGFNYLYQLANASLDGEVAYLSQVAISTGAGDSVYVPETMVLKPAYPNPFNHETIINYVIDRETSVNLSVLNLMSQTVKRLVSDELQPTNHFVIDWDGSDDYGNDLPSGVYFVVLKTGWSIHSQRLLLLR